MKRLLICLAAFVCACTPPAAKTDAPPADAPMADAAGNRMEALGDNGGRWCSGDGVWCVGALDDSTAVVTRGGETAATIPVTNIAEVNSWEAWPHVIRVGRNDASAIVGIVSVDRQMYSGGGASVRRASLFEVASGQEAQQVLVGVPISAEAMIRACFTEEHAAARQDACHDEYDFTGAITLDPDVAQGPPRLILTTVATSFPGQRTRASDSATEAPLQQGDLVLWRDDACSYRRVATREGASYVWDAPLPACADYLEP
jgi:hypothetical protein